MQRDMDGVPGDRVSSGDSGDSGDDRKPGRRKSSPGRDLGSREDVPRRSIRFRRRSRPRPPLWPLAGAALLLLLLILISRWLAS
ncbi:MAG: hypothetical protein R6X25_05945 [Candidatus Krumholzibacteriia bacterium]